MLKRLRIKFICINMAIVLAMLLVIFGVELQVTRRNLARESADQLELIAERLGRREDGEFGQREGRGEYGGGIVQPGGVPDKPDGDNGPPALPDLSKHFKPVDDPSYGVKHLDDFKKEMGQYLTQEEDVLSYALFPQVAEKFFQNRQAKQIGLDNSVLDKKNNAMPL